MYIQKRAYSYYFRLAIPQRIQAFYGKSEICFSLNTLNRKDAKLKSLEYVQHYLVDFEQKKSLPPPVVSTDMMISNQCTGTCNDGGIGAGGSGISGMTCNADKAADVIEYVFSSVYQKYVVLFLNRLVLVLQRKNPFTIFLIWLFTNEILAIVHIIFY